MDFWEKCYEHMELRNVLGWHDLALFPIYALVIYFFAYRVRNNLSKEGRPLRKYFIRGLSMKILGAVLAGLIYQYYYHGGDTCYFWSSASTMYEFFYNDISLFFRLMDSNPIVTYPELRSQNLCLQYIADPKSWMVIRLATIFNILAFDSYMVTSLFFSCISFYGSWKVFELLYKIYPHLEKEFFYSIFYMPSVVFWGSGIFKDTLTLSGLLLMVYHMHDLFIQRRRPVVNVIMIAISVYVVSSIRTFFIVIMLPCMGLWYFISFRDSIRNATLRRLAFPMLIVTAFLVIIFGFSKFAANSKEFNQQTLKQRTSDIQSWHGSLGGSAYTLNNDGDFSGLGLLKKFPAGVNVALFRPYLWETRSFFQLICALQSLFFLYYTIRTILRAGIVYFLTIITTDSLVLFCLVFSVCYAFVSGFTSFNFGALDRYKIPCLSFYIIAMIVIDFKVKLWKRGILSKQGKEVRVGI